MEKESEHKEEILDLVKKASSEDYETQWDDKGVPQVKKKSEMEKGRKSRKSGGDFELKVRKDLEAKGWTVAKWPNNVDMETKKVIPAKRKFNPFSKAMTLGTGFPDFVAFQLVGERTYNVIGVESKLNGTLSKEEKEKCAFLLQNKIFNEIWVSEKSEKRGGPIIYKNFKEEYGTKYDS
ncbi:MAG: hypothetical protein WCI72_04450 [archaeon]